MKILIYIWLLLLGFNSFAQSQITELWSKEDSVAKTRPALPPGYGSLYYNKYKAQWWAVENGVRKRAFITSGDYWKTSGTSTLGANVTIAQGVYSNSFTSSLPSYSISINNANTSGTSSGLSVSTEGASGSVVLNLLGPASSNLAKFQVNRIDIYKPLYLQDALNDAAGTDKIVLYDNTSKNLLKLGIGSGLSVSGGNLTASGGSITGSGTTNELTYWTSSSAIGALPVATYPSLTELSYGKGVTSAIQTQLNNKQATVTGGATTITSSNLTADRVLVSSGAGKVDVTSITDVEVGWLSGATGPIQGQLDNKIDGTMASTRIPYGVDANSLTSEAAITYDATLNLQIITNAASTATTSIGGGELQFDDISNSDDLTINNAGISSTGKGTMFIGNNSGTLELSATSSIFLTPSSLVEVTGGVDASGAMYAANITIGAASSNTISTTTGSVSLRPAASNSQYSVAIQGGDASSGNTNGGDATINGGDPAGSGLKGDVVINNGTGDLRVTSNTTLSRAVLVGGTVVVSSTKVTANSNIFLTCQINGGTVGAVYVSARTPGTSFTITSTSGTDTSTIAWLILEP